MVNSQFFNVAGVLKTATLGKIAKRHKERLDIRCGASPSSSPA